MLNYNGTLPPEPGKVTWTEAQTDKLNTRFGVGKSLSALSAFELEEFGDIVGDSLMVNFGEDASADSYSGQVTEIADSLTSGWHPDARDKFMSGLLQGAGVVAPVVEGAEV